MKKSHVFEWNNSAFQQKVLAWYDQNRRILPWRAKKNSKPSPYHVWLSEVMLQQTTVPAVKKYFERFTSLWPTIHDLANSPPDAVMQEWAGLGYYARARNLIKCAGIVSADLNGKFPETEKDLKLLPGIGPYTAAAISSIAFGNNSVVVDGNVERIASRVFMVDNPMPLAKKEIHALAKHFYEGITSKRAGDMPQALMDIGATVCTPKSPKCEICPISDLCTVKQRNENPNLYPRKLPKAKKPHREGKVYWLETEAKQILIEKRSDERMLGWMFGFPGTSWDGVGNDFTAPDIDWDMVGDVTHIFTHFSLKLEVLRGRMPVGKVKLNKNQYLIDITEVENVGFPSLYKKVLKLALPARNMDPE